MKEVPNYPGYFVTCNGLVWSSKSNRYLKQFRTGTNKYLKVALRKDNKTYLKTVHRLVLEAYIGPCPIGMECCHRNNNINDNSLSNLRWDTRSNNRKDSMRDGRLTTIYKKGDNVGEKNPRAKLTLKDVIIICMKYNTGKFTQKELAEEYGVKLLAIHRAIHNITWKCRLPEDVF